MTARINPSRRTLLQGKTLSLFAPGATIASNATQAMTGTRRRWYEGDHRIVQTNLREIDALHDPRDIAGAVSDFGANVIVSNIGGIITFYPADLECHYRNPYLRGDFVGEMIEAAHSDGMAYFGRFDLAKGMPPASGQRLIASV